VSGGQIHSSQRRQDEQNRLRRQRLARFGQQREMNGRNVEDWREKDEAFRHPAAPAQDIAAIDSHQKDCRLNRPARANGPDRQVVDLAVAERNFPGPEDEDSSREALGQMGRCVVPDVLDGDAAVFLVGLDSRDRARIRIGRLGPDQPDIFPLMDVLEHRFRGQLFTPGHGAHAPIELGPIVDVVGQMRQFVLQAARPGGLP